MSVDRRLESEADRFGDRPVRTTIRWGLAVTAVFVVLALVVAGVGFAGGWIGAGKDIVSPMNVKEQYRAVIENYEALRAAAANACQARAGARAHGDPTLVETPALAYEAQYRRIEVDYNRRQANVFEAEKVGPTGYPREAPSLAAMQKEVC
jgi:hypothetical protein